MTTGHPPIGRRALAGAAALALGLVGLGSAAFAADPLAPGNIDPEAKGSLTIHKHIDGTQTPLGTPDGKTEVTAKGIAGVEFTAFPIKNLDLSVQSNWNGLDKLEVPTNACGLDGKTPSLTLPGSLGAAQFDQGIVFDKTDDQGSAKKDGLAVKAYLVCETYAPANIVQKAAPFFVTIPFPNNTANATNGNGSWLYDVHVYPKNKPIDRPTKTVEVNNNGLSNDGQITYTVSQKVPAIGAGYSFLEFIIGDKMSAGQDAETSNVESVKLDDGSELAFVTMKDVSGKLYVSLKSAALETLKTKAGKTVVVTFKTKATQVGLLENSAEAYIKAVPGGTPPDTPPTPPKGEEPQPTNKVVSSWGDAIIAKQDKDNQKKLSGAIFEVYNAKAAYDGSCTKEIEGSALTINGKTSFTTGADGTVKIDGLFVDKGTAAQKTGADGKPVFDTDGKTPVFDEPTWEHNNTHRCYVLKETAAPAGYVLPTGDAALTPLKVTPNATASSTVDVTIDNTKQNVPQLPLTGANGQLLLLIGGSALILLAFGGAFVLRRHGKQG